MSEADVGDYIRFKVGGKSEVGKVVGKTANGRLLVSRLILERGHGIVVDPEQVDLTVARKKEG